MLLCFKRDFVAFQNLFNQIDAPARPVQFIAQKLIGWAGCGTKSAVNTGAQDAVGFQRAFCRISSVNRVCIACSSKFRVHATGVKHAARVELLFKLLVIAE